MGLILGFLLLCVTGSFVFAQNVNDLGKMTFEQVKRSFSSEPCEVTGTKMLRYCAEDGSMLAYSFENNKLNGINVLKAFPTQLSAEREMEKMIKEFSDKVKVKPAYTNGLAIFTMTENIGVTYEISKVNGTYYVVYRTLLY